MPALGDVPLTEHENVPNPLLPPPTHPPSVSSVSLHAPVRPTASPPRDQLQALMKRQSGN